MTNHLRSAWSWDRNIASINVDDDILLGRSAWLPIANGMFVDSVVALSADAVGEPGMLKRSLGC